MFARVYACMYPEEGPRFRCRLRCRGASAKDRTNTRTNQIQQQIKPSEWIPPIDLMAHGTKDEESYITAFAPSKQPNRKYKRTEYVRRIAVVNQSASIGALHAPNLVDKIEQKFCNQRTQNETIRQGGERRWALPWTCRSIPSCQEGLRLWCGCSSRAPYVRA